MQIESSEYNLQVIHIMGVLLFLHLGHGLGKLTKIFKKSIPIYHTHAEAIVSEKLPRIIHHHIGISGFYEAVHGNERAVTLGLGQHRNGSLLISNAIQPADEIDCRSSYWGMPAIENKFMKFFPQLSNIRILRSVVCTQSFFTGFPAWDWMATGFR